MALTRNRTRHPQVPCAGVPEPLDTWADATTRLVVAGSPGVLEPGQVREHLRNAGPIAPVLVQRMLAHPSRRLSTGRRQRAVSRATPNAGVGAGDGALSNHTSSDIALCGRPMGDNDYCLLQFGHCGKHS